MSNPDVSDPAQDALIRQMRDQIVDNDFKLMLAVNKRLELVAALRRYKESQGLEFVDHSREEWMHRYLQGANRGPLSRDGLTEIYGHLLELTKRETARSDG
jgi:chorismate mutase